MPDTKHSRLGTYANQVYLPDQSLIIRDAPKTPMANTRIPVVVT